MKQPQKRKRTAADRLAAALPGLLGLGLTAAGLGIVRHARENPPHESSGRLAAVPLAAGVAALGCWPLANNDDGYNL